MDLDELDRRRAFERTLILIRWGAAAFALVQVLTFYKPYPQGMLAVALGLVVTLLIGNVALAAALKRTRSAASMARLSLTAMAFDFLLVFGLVAVYTFDVETAIFILIYILPLEAALRYGMRGALWVMGAATAVYTAREAIGSALYDFPFLPVSISFRMGVGFIIAAVAGSMARRYTLEHEQVRQLYEREKAAADALRRMDQLKSTFLTAVAHELRTPLTSVLGFSLTLEEHANELTDEHREMLQLISTEAHRLDSLLDDLLDLHRLTRGWEEADLAAFDVGELTRDTVHRIAELRSRNVQVQAEPVVAHIDRDKVEKILENLLRNALRHTPRDASIWVSVQESDGGVLIGVDDDGPGIPADMVEQVFEPFLRSSAFAQHSPGTGVGLSLVREFSHLHGGRAWVEERDGGGAAFRVYLPRQRTTATGS